MNQIVKLNYIEVHIIASMSSSHSFWTIQYSVFRDFPNYVGRLQLSNCIWFQFIVRAQRKGPTLSDSELARRKFDHLLEIRLLAMQSGSIWCPLSARLDETCWLTAESWAESWLLLRLVRLWWPGLILWKFTNFLEISFGYKKPKRIFADSHEIIIQARLRGQVFSLHSISYAPQRVCQKKRCEKR